MLNCMLFLSFVTCSQTLNLSCTQTIDYTSSRGGVSVLTSTHRSPRPTSTLLVSSVGPGDGGKYSCRPSNAEGAAVTVHIIDGEWQSLIDLTRIIAFTCKK